MYRFLSVYLYVPVYAYVHVYVFVLANVYIYIYIHACMYIHVYIISFCGDTHALQHVCTYVCDVHVQMHISTQLLGMPCSQRFRTQKFKRLEYSPEGPDASSFRNQVPEAIIDIVFGT